MTIVSRNLKIAPRWSIFILDVACFAISLLAAYLIKYNFDITYLKHFEYSLLLMLPINIVMLYLFKPYAGVIRYTSMEDAKRVFFFNTVVSFLFLLVSLVCKFQGYYDIAIPNGVLFIYFFSSNFSMLLYRVIIKTTYQELFTLRKKGRKAAVFNAAYEGLLARRMFNDNERSDVKVKAFIDYNPSFKGKILENTPVYPVNENTFDKLKKEGIELLIIADPFIKSNQLNELVDMSLTYGIQIQQVPSSEKWTSNDLDTPQLKNVNIEQLLEREVIAIQNENVGLELKGKRVLVTGAAGSIGSEIVRQVLKYNPAVVVMCDVAETPLHELRLSLNDHKLTIPFIGDITQRSRMEQIFETYAPQVIYHAAAYKHVPLMEEHPSVAVINNVLGTKNLAELAVQYNVEKFVMVSTDKAVNPTNVMGASKRIAEIFTQSYYKHLLNNKNEEHFTKFITTRFGNVLGSNGSVIPRFKQQIEDGGPITVTHPDITRYFMTIPEACQLVLEAGTMGEGGEIFVFDMGKPVKIVDLAYKMIQLSGLIPNTDIKIEYSGLRPGEKLYEELLNNAENTLPTYHEKILIAQVREFDFAYVVNEINELISLASKHLAYETVGKMKEIVPEFKSNNSVFSKLDKN